MLIWAHVFLVLAVAGQWVLQVFGHRAADFFIGASLHGIATAAYIVLALAAVRGDYRPRLWQALLLVAGLRVLALPLEPALSDDIYRYMHEGQLVLEGENPYLTSPADIAEEHRHPVYYAKINNKDVPAAYPPAVQFALAAGVAIRPTPLGQKLVFGLCDLLAFLVLWSWLPAIGIASQRAVIYGYCPLLALEFAGEGHSDSLAVLFLACCLWAFSRAWRHGAAACLALSCAAKLMPVAVLPFVARRRWWTLATFAGVLGLTYLPFALDDAITSGVRPLTDLFAGALRYGDVWRANDSLFHLLHLVGEWLGSALSESETLRGAFASIGLDPTHESFAVRIVKFPVAILGLSLLALGYARKWPLHKAAAAFIMFFLTCTPVLHPWYTVFLVPFLCVYPQVMWLVFTGTVYLAYHVLPDWLSTRVWAESVGIKVLEYLPFYLGFIPVLKDERERRAMYGEEPSR